MGEYESVLTKGMFYMLHRLVKWFFTALVLAGLYWVWLQRAAIEPVYVWYDVYENGGLKNDSPLEEKRGRVVAVVDGHTVQMKHDGKSYAVRLTGLQIPEPPLATSEIAREKERRELLRNLLIGQEVNVQVSYATPASLLGIVSVNGTNINLMFITNGLGRFNATYVKGAPRDLQYQFFAAERVHDRSEKTRTLASAAE
jgi:endonuclease YncB( thermonuclease family)